MTTTEQGPVEGESGGRVAGGCVLAVGLAAAGGVAVVHPEAAYFVSGLVATAGYRKARGWIDRRRGETAEEEAPVDILAVLRDLTKGGDHARLTQIQEAAKLPTTKAVRDLLEGAGIRIRGGVRAGGKNGPGVHRDDVPPLPSPESGTPSGGCLCSSGANTNANNSASTDPRKGLSVEAIGQAGAVVRVEAERRTYTV
ncbi:hypothetical protein [Streptomyces sp. H27-H5]|uniref:hypothetical protein n=1 Tax=Streptomyces sp. H27-H5 TaxID=2996460 RepID=UPI002270B9A3|nr:hypothetical protein [Streptomyces sp. H27-H5]MCY0960853.1 hypothetical protein [Streptomyces sp. H27-H5]